jgi:hypothetical protein
MDSSAKAGAAEKRKKAAARESRTNTGLAFNLFFMSDTSCHQD